MRAALGALLLISLTALPACARRGASAPPETEPTSPVAAEMPSRGGRDAGLPAWLGPYSSAQLALLAPTDAPVQVPARRVFPDLARFAYADNRAVDDPREMMKFTRMVATVLRDSPLFYSLQEGPPELSNLVAQYGPPGLAESDAWHVTRRDAEGIGTLVVAPMSANARADFERGSKLYADRDLRGAVEAFSSASQKSPGVPGLWLALGQAHVASGETKEARAAFEQAIRVDPTFASAHAEFADLLAKTGDVAAARAEIAEALALHPSSKRSLEVADFIVPGAAGDGDRRVLPFKIFVDVDATGAIRVASGSSAPAQIYGGCRAVMRYEPDVRAAIFELPRETPYFLSVVEEVVCLESALGAYLFERASEEGAPSDASVEALIELAQRDGLSGYAMFEILGQQRPERARMAPPDVHSAMVKYVEDYVLGGSAAPPEHATTITL